MKILFIIFFLFFTGKISYSQVNETTSERHSFFSIGFWNEEKQDVDYAGLEYKPGEKFWFSLKPYSMDPAIPSDTLRSEIIDHINFEKINSTHVVLKILKLLNPTTYNTNQADWQLISLSSYDCNPDWINICGQVRINKEGIYTLEIYDDSNNYLNQSVVRIGYQYRNN
ncbi:hypothetical protein BH10BAC5_BH10BAC5_18870 [soil metagenome]